MTLSNYSTALILCNTSSFSSIPSEQSVKGQRPKSLLDQDRAYPYCAEGMPSDSEIAPFTPEKLTSTMQPGR
jgi:hypothetical protein